VNPIYEQRGFAELDKRAKTGLRKAPATPGIGERQNQQKKAATRKKKIGVGVPVVVDGVEMNSGFVEKLGEDTRRDTADSKKSEGKCLSALSEVRVKDETNAETNKGESCPGKEWKEPGLRFIEDVDAVDVRLEGPGEELRTKRGPERRSDHSDERCSYEAGNDGVSARGGDGFAGREEAQDAHEHHGKAEDVQNIDAEEVSPGSIAERKRVFLNAKEKTEAENFRAAKNGLLSDDPAVNSLLSETLGDESKRNPRKKNEEWRWKCAAELRPAEKWRFTSFRAKPGVIAMRLEHEHASEAAHPVDIGETFHEANFLKRTRPFM